MANKTIEDLLPEEDVVFLREKYPQARVYEVGDEVHVVLPSFPFPPAYNPRSSDLLIRLPSGYPDARTDMFWTFPDVKLSSGSWPEACAHHEIPGAGPGVETYNNVAWQRWSRHLAPNDWRPGIDRLRNFVAAIRRELERQV